MKNIFTLIIAVVFVLIGQVVAQTAGTLNLNFGTDGKYIFDKDNMDLYQDVKVQTDGKIVAIGTTYTPSYTSSIQVTRLMPDGTPDASFADNGQYSFTLNSETGAYKCLIKNDGKILVAGYTTNYSTYWSLLIQLNEDGTPDPEFGDNGVVLHTMGTYENFIYALALQDDGAILTAGYTQNSEYRNVPTVLRFSETGILDTSFGIDGAATIPVTEIDNDFSAISLQSDGKIVAAGHISNGMSWFSLLVARFDQNGVLDPTYGTDGVVNMNLGNVDDEFYDMVITGNDEAILTGFVVSQSDLAFKLLLMKLDNSGYLSLSFGLGGFSIWGEVPFTFGDAMALQPDGKILVAGSTGELAPGNNDWAVWRFNADGNIDNTFGTNGVSTLDLFGNAEEALGIALYQDKIILAGKTRNAENKLDFAVAEFMNDNYFNVSVPEATSNADFVVTPNPVSQNSTTNLYYELNQPEEITVEMVNVSGTSVFQMQLGKQSAGKQSIQMNLPTSISKGMYFVKVKGSLSTYLIQKVIVL
jgi:uncharacterized delta-60 repeat protein